jgi:TonB family protein
MRPRANLPKFDDRRDFWDAPHMKRELLSILFLLSACAPSPPTAEAPPPRAAPAPDDPTPVPVSDDDAGAPREEVATSPDERDGDPKGDPLRSDDAGPDENLGTLGNGGPGSLDPAIIHRVVRQHTAKIKACYNQALAKDPNAKGSLRVSFIIAESGAVTGTSVERASGIPDLDRCVAGVFIGMRFPKPKGGTVTVKYPFVFAST